MAKRKRLQPPNAAYLAADAASPAPAPFAAPPIAGVAGDAASTAAATELAETLRTARETGRMVLDLPLDQVDPGYLVRDRMGVDEAEMDALVASLRARGQQTPIEAVDFGENVRPRYGLISGWRRMQALARIAREDGETVTVLALLRTPQDASDAYLAMVEENEIRVGLSYYERARIARKAVDQGAYADTKAALLSLYHAASRAKRSKIRSFVTVVDALEGVLRFPEALGERTGLQLAKALEADATLPRRLETALADTPPTDGSAEQKIIADVVSGKAKKDPVSPKKGLSAAQRAERMQLADGVYYSENGKGEVVLAGDGVTDAFRSALITWVQVRLGTGD